MKGTAPLSRRSTRASAHWLLGAATLATLARPAAALTQDAPGNTSPATPGSTTMTAPDRPVAKPSPVATNPPSAAPAGRPVSLEEALQIAFQNQGSVAVAEESVEQARQRVRQARVGTLPQVVGSVGYQLNGTSNLGGIFGGGSGGSSSGAAGGGAGSGTATATTPDFIQSSPGLQPAIGLTYTPFDSGLTRASVRQARADVEGSQAGLVVTRNNLSLTVTTNYLLQLRAQQLLALRHVQEQLAEEQLRSVQARIAAGSAAVADQALILSQYRNTQVDRIQAENDLRTSANTLRNSMGLPVGPLLELVERSENQVNVPPVEDLREVARRHRPEVAQDEAAVRAAEAGQSIARIGRKPRLNTSVVFNVNPNTPANRSNFTIGANVAIPIWDAGLTQSRELVARSQIQAAVAQLEQTKKDVAADVEQAYLTLVNARERLAAARLAVDASRVNLEAATARYQLGAAGATVVELIQAQVQFATASNSAITALYDVQLAQAQLDRAIGR